MKIVSEKSKYHRFALYYDYSPEKVEFCRQLKESFGWDRFNFDVQGELKRWVFSDSFLVPVLVEKFPETQVDPQVEIDVKNEQAWSREKKEREEKIDNIKTKKDTDFHIKGLKGELYPYQKVGVEFLVASGGRAIIADSPGLGKTLQALALIKHEGYKRSLIVCPASVKFSWEMEVKKWTRMSSIIIDSKTDLGKISPDVNVWIVNYDILTKHLPQLSKIRFDCLVGDECQYIKSTGALRTKAFRMISRDIPKIVLLSGTPLLSRPSELFSLLNIIDKNVWNNWYDFARRYCAMHRTRWGVDTSGASNTEELHKRIKRYFIRRDKTEVLKELPPKTFITTPVQLDKKSSSEYDAAASDFADYLRQLGDEDNVSKSLAGGKLTQLNVLRQIGAMGKVGTAIELIESILESGEKVLVFCSFVAPLEAIRDHFSDKTVLLTGQTPVEERGAIVEKFQNNKDVTVFLGGIKSAGVGITLTAASNVIFIDYSWNPADHQQAQDRVHRPGQKAQSINIYQLFARDTIDEDLKEILDNKQNIFDKVIEGKFGEKMEKDAVKSAMKRILKKY